MAARPAARRIINVCYFKQAYQTRRSGNQNHRYHRHHQASWLAARKLVDVLNFDYDAVSTLLTRTTSPQLTAVEIAAMATGDFTALCEEITPFLTKAEPSAATEAATASK